MPLPRPVTNSPATEAPAVLIVQASSDRRAGLLDLLHTLGHRPVAVGDADAAREAIDTAIPDLVIVDAALPGEGAATVIRHLTATPAAGGTGSIVLAAAHDIAGASRCMADGADDFLIEPFDPTLLLARINRVIDRRRWRQREADWRGEIDRFAHQLESRVREQVELLTTAQRSTIFALSKLAESRDPETGEHLERMREYCRVLARGLQDHDVIGHQIDEVFIENLYAACPLHDIGKVGIPDHILQKPGRLSPEEFAVMQRHASIGGETLRAVDRQHPGNAFILMGMQIALAHHEKWDGTGYPIGLMGDWIPLAGRIVAVGDVYDALTSRRCYKEAFTHARSREMIIAEAGRHFDPRVIEVFKRCEDEFIEIARRYADPAEPDRTEEDAGRAAAPGPGPKRA